MRPNVGMTDKLIRYVSGVILISLHLSGVVTGALGVGALAVAFMALLTGLFNFCPLYLVLGRSTWSSEPKPPGKY